MRKTERASMCDRKQWIYRNMKADQLSRKGFLLLKAGHYRRTVVKKGSLCPVTKDREIRYERSKSHWEHELAESIFSTLSNMAVNIHGAQSKDYWTVTLILYWPVSESWVNHLISPHLFFQLWNTSNIYYTGTWGKVSHLHTASRLQGHNSLCIWKVCSSPPVSICLTVHRISSYKRSCYYFLIQLFSYTALQ